MTQDRDFKQVVRMRMAQTGEAYMAARAALEQQAPPRMATPRGTIDQTAYDAARREQERLVGRLFTDGRLAQIPAKRRTRAAALLEVLTRFEPGRVYTEPKVNEVLLGVHEDFAYLRRELVNYRYLERVRGRYRVVAQAPARALIECQEIPDWEAAWLPEFLAGGHGAGFSPSQHRVTDQRQHPDRQQCPSAAFRKGDGDAPRFIGVTHECGIST